MDQLFGVGGFVNTPPERRSANQLYRRANLDARVMLSFGPPISGAPEGQFLLPFHPHVTP